MPPADDTPEPDPTVNYDATPSPGRQKLSEALRACLFNDASVQSFLNSLSDNAADVSEWIDEDLRAHFDEQWQNDEKNWPRLDRYVQSLLSGYRSAVKQVYRASRTAADAECPKLSRFTERQSLGAGGFGEVFKARQTDLDRFVAIKLLDSPGSLTEPRTAAKFNGAGFVTVHDVFSTKTRRLAIVMEFVEAPTLAQSLRKAVRPIELRRACNIMVSFLDTLAKLHADNVVHNDLKPANLFLMNDDTILISDLGGATRVGETLRQFTCRYSAPELFRGSPKASIKTDIYSAACIAYEVLVGRACHRENQPHDGAYEEPSGLPSTLKQAIKEGLQRDSNDRTATAKEFAEPFRDYLNAAPTADEQNTSSLIMRSPAEPFDFARRQLHGAITTHGVDNRSLREPLFDYIRVRYDMNGLKILIGALGEDWDNIDGTIKDVKAMNLILEMERRGDVRKLLEYVLRTRN